MNPQHAIWQDGELVFDRPPQWPNGKEVWVCEEIPKMSDAVEQSFDPDSDDPEQIKKWLEAFHAIPRVDMLPEDDAAWQMTRQEQRSIDIANFDKDTDDLKRMTP